MNLCTTIDKWVRLYVCLQTANDPDKWAWLMTAEGPGYSLKQVRSRPALVQLARLMHTVTESITFQHKKDCILQHARFILTSLMCTANFSVKELNFCQLQFYSKSPNISFTNICCYTVYCKCVVVFAEQEYTTAVENHVNMMMDYQGKHKEACAKFESIEEEYLAQMVTFTIQLASALEANVIAVDTVCVVQYIYK